MYIAFGLIVRGEGKATNNLIIVFPKGKVQASFAKIHSVSYAGENDCYEQGKEIVITRRSSMIIDAEGNVCMSITCLDEVDIYDIDMSSVDRYRKEFPVKSDRRNCFYKKIL